MRRLAYIPPIVVVRLLDVVRDESVGDDGAIADKNWTVIRSQNIGPFHDLPCLNITTFKRTLISIYISYIFIFNYFSLPLALISRPIELIRSSFLQAVLASRGFVKIDFTLISGPNLQTTFRGFECWMLPLLHLLRANIQFTQIWHNYRSSIPVGVVLGIFK